MTKTTKPKKCDCEAWTNNKKENPHGIRRVCTECRETSTNTSDWTMERARRLWEATEAVESVSDGITLIAAALDKVWEDLGGDKLVTVARCIDHKRCAFSVIRDGCDCVYCLARTAIAKHEAALVNEKK